ncbi:hypothetical protein [Actinoallomurus acaciae]|uniref:Transposase n=1 Tax=Actinoallomurus acaciae TaxID=502577 RepID=A0ABV5Y921_9ACTN
MTRERGVRRGKKLRATVRDDGHVRATDLLQRDFTAARPDQRWVADFTHVATWSGVVYVVGVFSGRSSAGPPPPNGPNLCRTPPILAVMRSHAISEVAGRRRIRRA